MKIRSLLTDQSGSALMVVLIFTLLVGVLSGTILIGAGVHYRLASRQVLVEQAEFIAEAASERAAQYIESRGGYLANLTSGSGTLSGSKWTYTIEKTGWRTYKLGATGTVNGVSRAVRISRVYLPTYAQYALWMHTNGEIYFIPGEVFDGQVHSNDKLWFWSSAAEGGPVFWEKVSSAWESYGGVIDWVTFAKGFELGADEGSMADIDFNSSSSSSLRNLAYSFGTVLEGRTYITFDGDKLKITNSRKGWNNHERSIGEDDILYVKNSSWGSWSTRSGKVYLEGGEVDGRLTIVSEDDIFIEDHIRYADDPRENPDSNDALGLISKDDIWVTTSAPNNLHIDAALIAAGQYYNNRGSFGVLNYDRGWPRGDLIVFGSIVQDKRGAVGTFSSSDGQPRTGYSKDYSFDDRFESLPPPYYPVVDEQIVFEGWSDGPA